MFSSIQYSHLPPCSMLQLRAVEKESLNKPRSRPSTELKFTAAGQN
jgi:hypothetical protein